MALRRLILALTGCLALGVAACGGEETPDAGPAQARPAEDATTGERETRARSGAAAPGGDDERAGTGPERTPEREQPSEPEDRPQRETRADRREPEQPEGAEPREGTRAELKRALDRAKATVRTVIRLISDADAAVCRRFFTQRYAELVSGREGDAAFGKCERDIGASKGTLELTAFGPSRVEDDTAFVKFNVEAAGNLRSEQFRLLYVDGRWLVDGTR